MTEISQYGEPFNFTLLTADTHFPDGYLDDSCDMLDQKDHYSSTFHCSDGMVAEFLDWITQQEFYENTVIIIVGDHLGMQTDFYDTISIDYERTVYNTIINSSAYTENTKNREFSTLDMYPTTIAALGATIQGNQLGFGVNLYSDDQTLIEKLGFKYFDNEIKKRSIYYEDKILKDTLKEMLI